MDQGDSPKFKLLIIQCSCTYNIVGTLMYLLCASANEMPLSRVRSFSTAYLQTQMHHVKFGTHMAPL